MTDAERLVLFIQEAARDPERAGGEFPQLSPEYGALGEAVRGLAGQLRDVSRRESAERARSRERRYAHYRAYSDYISSFAAFRERYKSMMGEVYDLFSRGKYDEGRLLVAKINDLMGTQVNVFKAYSNHDLVNAVLTDTAAVCAARGVPFSAKVHVPAGLADLPDNVFESISDMADLVVELLDCGGAERSVRICSLEKPGWLSISAECRFGAGRRAEKNAGCAVLLERMKTRAESAGAVLDLRRADCGDVSEILLHIPVPAEK